MILQTYTVLSTKTSELVGVDDETKFVVTDPTDLRVYGLNLSVPEDAKVIIKPWNEREQTDKCAESGVDDQVSVFVM
jgi:hypothetical protein